MLKRLTFCSLTVLVGLLASCGSDSDSANARTVNVEMKDISFSPTTLTVQPGRATTFKFTNSGKLEHEAIIGDQAGQDQHEQEMTGGSASSDMEHGRDRGSDAVTVMPGDSADLTYTFKTSDDGIIIGCHEEGHYEAGMLIKVSVQA